MTDEERIIQKYINEKKELYELVLRIIEEPANDEDFQKLEIFLNTHQYKGDKMELEHFLRLILIITLNHNRQPDFFKRIGKILLLSSKFFKPIFSNTELFTIFQQSKPILYFLLKTKMITIDEILLFQNFLNFSELKEGEPYYYFYPELDSIIKSGTIDGINAETYSIKLNEDIEKFEGKRRTFENESKICRIIRNDSIEDFIKYISQSNISIYDQIKRSPFETNSMLIEKEPALIEYAAFFGSIRIMKYLEINGVKMKPSIWQYAVHSNNPEVIQFLEEKGIEIDDMAFSEAIKCHHNSIAHYIYDNYLGNPTGMNDLSDENVLSIFSSENYEFFPNEVDGNKIFFSLCQCEYYNLVSLYLTTKENDIENYINQKKNLEKHQIIIDALEENKIDVAYHLLKGFESIPDRYFANESKITKIALPPTIKSIGELAFFRDYSLMYISIPPSVNSIEESAFSTCSLLKLIKIPSSITSIKKMTFALCSSIIEISLPSSLTSIESSAFGGCSFTRITIPSSVTSIGSSAFCGCLSLTQIIIPSSVTSIGDYAFSNCSSVTQIMIPSSVKSIENNAFANCSFVTQIMIPSSVNSMSDFIFYECSYLIQITIPSSVTSIGSSAFKNCASLKKITIPSSVNSIGPSAFEGCRSLENIEIIQNQVKRIDYFEGALLIYKTNPESDVFDTLVWAKKSLTKISIPSFIKKIDERAFNQCCQLKQVTIPSSVTEIGANAFGSCWSLTQVSFELPSSLKSIGSYAFDGCFLLTNIQFPSSVTSFGENVFNG